MIFDTLVFGESPLEVDKSGHSEAQKSFLRDLNRKDQALVHPEYKAKYNSNLRARFWHERVEVFYDSSLTIQIDSNPKNKIAIHFNPECNFPFAKTIRITVHVDKNKNLENTNSILSKAILHPYWSQLISNSTLTDVHICTKLENIELDYFIQHSVYSYPQLKPHIKHNLITGKRTFYKTNNYYLYESDNLIKAEIRIDGREDISSKLGLIKYCDLVDKVKNKDIQLLKKLQKINQFKNTTFYNYPKDIDNEHISTLERRVKIKRKPIRPTYTRLKQPNYKVSHNSLMNHVRRLNQQKNKLFTDIIRPKLIKKPNILEYQYQKDLLLVFLPEILNESNFEKIFSHSLSKLRQ